MWKPKYTNVFVIRPKELNPKLKIKGHAKHAIFIESNNGVKYKGINSWGTNWPEIMIPVNKFEKKEIEIEEFE